MAIRPSREEYLARQYVVEKQCTTAQCLETVMAGLDDMLCQFEGALQGPAARRGELAARCLAVFTALERMSVVPEQDGRQEIHELDEQLAALYEQCSLLLLRSQAEQCTGIFAQRQENCRPAAGYLARGGVLCTVLLGRRGRQTLRARQVSKRSPPGVERNGWRSGCSDSQACAIGLRGGGWRGFFARAGLPQLFRPAAHGGWHDL